MGIQINGQTDIISASDGALTVSGATLPTAQVTSLNVTGIVTATTLRATNIVGVTTAGITTAYIGSINNGPLAGTRNKIINGAIEISQRGTTFAAIANNAYSIDRWKWEQNGTMVCTVSQSTDVPNDTFQNSYKVDVTTADTSIAAGEYSFIRQAIEGYNVRDLIGQTFTLSFWVKSPKTGIHCVSFRNSTPDRSYILEYTVSSTNTWEYKTLTVSGGLITAGTWNWTNGVGLDVIFSLTSGSTFHTTAGFWNTGNFLATSNQVNVMDNTANDFFLTGVQLEIGQNPTPFERRIYGQELVLAQRYAYAWGSVGLQVAAAGGNAMYSDANQIAMVPFGLNTSAMRDVAITITSVGTQGTDWAVQSSAGVNQTGFTLSVGSGAITVTKTSHGLGSSAVLRTLTTSGRIIVSTEL